VPTQPPFQGRPPRPLTPRPLARPPGPLAPLAPPRPHPAASPASKWLCARPSTPPVLLQFLTMGLHAVAESSADIHMELWHVFFVDERCVPLTHKDSNYSAVVTQLAAKVRG
jgi:hypothetical protein